MKNKIVYRYGDKVKIIAPELFIRCGYPKTIESETKIVIDEQGDQIKKMFKELGIKEIGFNSDIYISRTFKKIAREIAYCRLKQNGFGGSKREIYTNIVPELKGKIFEVVDKRCVKTGDYNSPNWCHDWYYGVYDYEPGYLSNVKTHVILEIQPCDVISFYRDKKIEIEEINVEKLIFLIFILMIPPLNYSVPDRSKKPQNNKSNYCLEYFCGYKSNHRLRFKLFILFCVFFHSII